MSDFGSELGADLVWQAVMAPADHVVRIARSGVTERVLGLHVKGGVLNYGLLDGLSGDHDSLVPVVGAPGRLVVNCGLVGASQLTDLADRFGQDACPGTDLWVVVLA